MNKQMTISMITDELAAAKTSKKEFLERIEKLIPWSKWIGIIKPIYYKGEVGNKPYELGLMLGNSCRSSHQKQIWKGNQVQNQSQTIKYQKIINKRAILRKKANLKTEYYVRFGESEFS